MPPLDSPVEAVTVRAPAKLNLHLGVGPLREDGFHELTTVYQALGLFDDVTVALSDALSVTVEGEGAGLVPADESNLAARAVLALAEAAGVAPHVAVTLRKGIPVAGGCAGGSADAAAALVGCDALWGLGSGRAELAGLAAGLGSDVPFSLHGGTALGTGRGERLTPVLGNGRYSWVLALAEGGLSTPAVYAELDRLRAEGPVTVVSDASEVLAALRQGSAELLGRALTNDLQAAALGLKPELGRLLAAGTELGALGGVVSGSGPTCAFLARDEAHATALAAALAGQGVCRTVRVAEGPVPGAKVTRTR
jgi:4-diphosphocytidyl-2-C-methyl-D-erythritol kinase